VSQPLLIATPRVVREPRMLSTCRAEAADFDPFEKKCCCLAQRTRARGPSPHTLQPPSVSALPSRSEAQRPLARSGGGGAHSAIWWRLKPWGRRAHGFGSARRIPSGLVVEALRSADLDSGEEELLTAPRLCDMVRVLSYSLAFQFPPSSFVWRVDFSSLFGWLISSEESVSRVQPTNSVRARCSRLCRLHLLGF